MVHANNSNVKTFFACVNDINNIRWHENEREYDGKIFHVVDSLKWKKIDLLFLNFDHEPRNLRLVLSTYLMIAFVNLSTNYTSFLQPIYVVVHEAQIYDVVYDDFGLKTTIK